MPRRKTSKRRTRAPRKSKSSTRSSVGPAFAKLVAVMARLRAPNGCPWDREQTHATLRTYLIEEAYEVLDALDGADDAKFAEELGDLLLQVLFHAQIAHEEGRFSISDVISEIYEKMIRRHPHVFGDKRAKDAAEVLRNWEIIKNEERQAKQRTGSSSTEPARRSAKREGESLLDGVPRTLPALLEAFQLTRKAARIGFDWHNLDGIFAKLLEETGELRQALSQSRGTAIPGVVPGVVVADLQVGSAGAPPSALQGGSWVSPSSSPFTSSTTSVEAEVGDILFVAVNLARFLNLDPEIALKKSSAKFSRRFRDMERLAQQQGTTLAQVPRPQMESLWDQAKLREVSAPSPEAPK